MPIDSKNKLTRRPASEEFACPLSRGQMLEFANIFAGKAEAIGEGGESKAPILDLATDADILALLRRRPCTVQGISAGLGLYVNEAAAKRLQTLVEKGSVTSTKNNDIIFYEAVRTTEKEMPAN